VPVPPKEAKVALAVSAFLFAASIKSPYLSTSS
jgi:hypothetical protein